MLRIERVGKTQTLKNIGQQAIRDKESEVIFLGHVEGVGVDVTEP